MKSFSIILFIVTISTRLYSQEFSDPGLIGTWKSVNAQIILEMKIGLDPDEEKQFKKMLPGFVGTLFNFKENNDFAIKFPKNVPEFMRELESAKNKKWRVGKDQRVEVGSEKDNYSMLGITVIIKQGKKYFILDETPFMIEVIRI
jgi:hypothetical protein